MAKARKYLFGFFVFSLMGCSTAHVHRDFRYQSVDGVTANQEGHERKLRHYPSAYYDEVTFNFGDAKIQLALLPQDVYGTYFTGPLFIPIFPIFWMNHKISNVAVDLNVISTHENKIEVQVESAEISLNDGPFLKASKIDSKDSLFYPGDTVNRFVFDFEPTPFPERVKIIFNTVRLNSVPLKPINVTFTKNSYWHYVPFIFMHTD